MSGIHDYIGQIIENAQYIEHNMALMIRFNEILRAFDARKSIPTKEYERLEESAVQLQEELSHKPMGVILRQVKEVKMFGAADVKCLESVLNSRNWIVHRYFKDNNFNDI
jgi:hypothetical protein